MIEKIPIPICGLILALFSLGNLLNDTHPYLKVICGLTAGIFLILILTKAVLYPESIGKDLKNPIIASNSGTFSMSLMILSTYLASFIPNVAYGVWILGAGLHILLIIYFTYHEPIFPGHVLSPLSTAFCFIYIPLKLSLCSFLSVYLNLL